MVQVEEAGGTVVDPLAALGRFVASIFMSGSLLLLRRLSDDFLCRIVLFDFRPLFSCDLELVKGQKL